MKILIATLCLSFGLTLFAKSKEAPRAMGMMKVLQQLDLTAEQKEKLKELRKNRKDGGHGKENVEEVRKLRQELKEKFASNASDSELRKINDKMKSLRSSKTDLRFERMMEVRAILTVEQRKKFQDLMEGKGRRKNKS